MSMMQFDSKQTGITQWCEEISSSPHFRGLWNAVIKTWAARNGYDNGESILIRPNTEQILHIFWDTLSVADHAFLIDARLFKGLRASSFQNKERMSYKALN